MTYNPEINKAGVMPGGADYNPALVGTADEAIQTYYFPPEMIGGSCPFVKGEEEALAWNAASEACGSERIHFVWQADGERLWYLAVRSSDLASSSNTWCPFASVLPGMPDAQPSPVIYTYFSDEAAVLMAVDRDSLQVIRGSPSVIKAKAERLQRETKAKIHDLVPDVIVNLKARLWDSLSLLENRARRFFAMISVLSAIAVTLISAFIWFSASLAQLAYRVDLSELQTRSRKALLELEQTAMQLRTSDMREQIATFNRLNESMISLQGWLKLYYMKGGEVKWWAVVPENLTSNRIQEIGGQTIESTPEGLVIANSAKAVIRKGQQQ
jgi:hypothetical protein